MGLDFSSHFFQIEIPELENREVTHKKVSFKIFGLESERPLIRMNNYFYQGKWVFGKNFIIFQSKNTKLSEFTIKSNFFVFPKNKKKTKIKTIAIDKNQLNWSPSPKYIITSKKLRLYRIPLLVKCLRDY